MPELPDLVIIRERLLPSLADRNIEAIEIIEPVVVRNLLGTPVEEAFVGLAFRNLEQHGPFLNFDFGGKKIIIHPMLAGRFSLNSEYKKKDLCVRFSFNGLVLNYADDVKMGKVYFANQGQISQIPKYSDQGINLLSAEFTEDKFLSLIDKSRQQTRVFLMDQTKLSALGNAYSDEILFAAGIHPKTKCHQLSIEDKKKLYRSVKEVLDYSIDYIRKKEAPLDFKVRDHVKVRNRKNEPCPRCGAKIRRANVLGYDSFFCPVCQPLDGEQFINWRPAE